ncbi:GntR family transcriptional regulator [Kocuria sp. JC486]|uniref:GntR family transcriptional regulator n=1 Tax=Kocuria sp. JC486 TaxID=1970736 RepID=UPI0014224A65|nr:GntR family transcriptional regulator [Kocuria sp. JC486]
MTHSDALADLLRQRIIDGEFMPGSRLSESALSNQFEVSRNTLRETYRALAEQGLLTHVPHRGVSVSAPSMADVVDIYRCRRTVECTTMRESRPEHPAVQHMTDALHLAETHLAAEDWLGIGSANMAFHEGIVALSDSPRLMRMYRNVAAELRLVFLTLDDPHALHAPFVASNRRVLTVFTAEGPEAGALELERYLLNSERSVLGAYTRANRA